MTNDLHHLAAPYALDAVEPDERNRFESHLAVCEQCQAELAGFLATAARLGEAEATAPPAGLRDRVVGLAGTTQQEHPVVTALAQRSRLRRIAPRIAMAAAIAVAVVGIGGFIVEHERAEDLSADRTRFTTLMTADDATTTEGAVAGGGTLRVTASPTRDAAVVVGSSLDPLDPGRTYQVWRMKDNKPTSAGMLGRGSGLLYVDGIDDTDAFAVSVEPAGGSDQPTTEPIALAPV
jgi:anti-sigma-K factor RskA